MARDCALKAYGFTLFCNPVVRNRVEFGGCGLQTVGSAVLADVAGWHSVTVTMSCSKGV